MNFGVVVFPGSNCDRDCLYVLSDVLGQSVNAVWHQENSLEGIDAIILPGGFSYGDYLRPGAIARFSPIMDSIKTFADQGGLVLGICNGFQVLLEVGLLPGAMLRNRFLNFFCDDVYVKVENTSTAFTGKYASGQILQLPVAHAEGNYYTDAVTLSSLKANAQVVFRYCSPAGDSVSEWNPNGSLDNIAGIKNAAGNVLGLMPHPERSAETILGHEDGKLLFVSMVDALMTASHPLSTAAG